MAFAPIVYPAGELGGFWLRSGFVLGSFLRISFFFNRLVDSLRHLTSFFIVPPTESLWSNGFLFFLVRLAEALCIPTVKDCGLKQERNCSLLPRPSQGFLRECGGIWRSGGDPPGRGHDPSLKGTGSRLRPAPGGTALRRNGLPSRCPHRPPHQEREGQARLNYCIGVPMKGTIPQEHCWGSLLTLCQPNG